MQTTATLIDLLSCPTCHTKLRSQSEAMACRSCNFSIKFRDGVAVAGAQPVPSYFDDKFEVMQEGHSNSRGEYLYCYDRQLRHIEPYMSAGKVVIDVGCGPGIHYKRDVNCQVIGLEPSFNSIRANTKVDLRVCGSAKEMPFANHSADAIVCFYSIHHMVGWTISETRENVKAAFCEFARVLKPGGDLFIAEMNPTPLAGFAQRAVWNIARCLLRNNLDQFFWSAQELIAAGTEAFPLDQLQLIAPETSPWLMIPPIFNMPRVKIPRWTFPLQSRLFHWTLGAEVQAARMRVNSQSRQYEPGAAKEILL